MISVHTLIAGGGVCLSLLGAVLFAVVYWRGMSKNRASRSWQQVASQVIESGVMGRGDESEPYATYEYQVGGRTYRNDRIFLVNTPSGHPGKIAAEYPVGRPVQVYYNPNNPAEAALVLNHPSARLYLGLTIMMLLLAAMICGMYWALMLFIAPV